MSKLFPAGSPAEEIAAAAMGQLTGGLLPPHVSVPLLGPDRTRPGHRPVTPSHLVTLFFAHMAGVFTSLVLLPGEM
ncbi:hypothetical protein ACFUAC_06650 [Streptomyces sp. NPDC057148]|uniref:hypothetical protein n=1 Tax=unclassified Streptomyces TaxID=2593676 RepID=UPI0036399AE2